MAYNNYVLTEKHATVVINSQKLTWVHLGAIGFKGCKNSGRIRALSGLKGSHHFYMLLHWACEDVYVSSWHARLAKGHVISSDTALVLNSYILLHCIHCCGLKSVLQLVQ